MLRCYQLAVIHVADVDAIEPIFPTGRGIQAAQEVHQGRLPEPEGTSGQQTHFSEYPGSLPERNGLGIHNVSLGRSLTEIIVLMQIDLRSASFRG